MIKILQDDPYNLDYRQDEGAKSQRACVVSENKEKSLTLPSVTLGDNYPKKQNKKNNMHSQLYKCVMNRLHSHLKARPSEEKMG